MTKNITIDPVTRIEGHLAVSIDVADGRVAQAHTKGEMFRGFEVILKGRDPLDAQQITQRICGVCPVSHGMASVLAQEEAYGVAPPTNGRLLRNLIVGANYIQSHILHFYQLTALDFVDIAAVTRYRGNDPLLAELKQWITSQQTAGALYPAAPFLPRYHGSYVERDDFNLSAINHYMEALKMRSLAQQMGVLFAGKMPHVASLVPGGVTEKVTSRKIAAYRSMLQQLQIFINNKYLQDVIGVASSFPEYFKIGKGSANYLAYGVFAESDQSSRMLLPGGVLISGQLGEVDKERITEDATYSFYKSGDPLSPAQGDTIPAPLKDEAYSWLKAPRYNGQPMEVGPLARMLVAYHIGRPEGIRATVDRFLSELSRAPEDLNSTLGRHAARALECKLVADRCAQWIEMLEPDKPTHHKFNIPSSARGVGMTEAPRGALGHWLSLEDRKIHRYQCVVPTTWNCSPRDSRHIPGPVEHALVDTPIADQKNPIEAARVVRSFDPCIACAVH